MLKLGSSSSLSKRTLSLEDEPLGREERRAAVARARPRSTPRGSACVPSPSRSASPCVVLRPSSAPEVQRRGSARRRARARRWSRPRRARAAAPDGRSARPLPMSCVTNRIVLPSSRRRWKTSKHFCWNAASPTASTSSMSRMSASAWIVDREGQAHVHARGVVLELEVDELLELGEGDDRRRSASRASRGGRPSMIALMTTLSRAARSGLKPTPSSMNVDMRPST